MIQANVICYTARGGECTRRRKEGGWEEEKTQVGSFSSKGREFAPTFNFPLLYASWRRVRPTPMSEHLFSPTDRPRRRRRMKRPDPPELRAEWTH